MIRGMFCVTLATLAGCAHVPVVVQLYGSESDDGLAQRIEAFATERQLRVERPATAPAEPDAPVTIVHGSQWRSALLAQELADSLRFAGTQVSIKPSRLQNHVVTGGHIGVFVRDPAAVGSPRDDDVDDVSQLICSRGEDAEAIILLFADGTMEIHTYLWRGDAITGHDYHGTWQATSDNTVYLQPEGRDAIAFRSASGRCAPTPNEGRPCRIKLNWISGTSIPVLTGCSVAVRNLVVRPR